MAKHFCFYKTLNWNTLERLYELLKFYFGIRYVEDKNVLLRRVYGDYKSLKRFCSQISL